MVPVGGCVPYAILRLLIRTILSIILSLKLVEYLFFIVPDHIKHNLLVILLIKSPTWYAQCALDLRMRQHRETVELKLVQVVDRRIFSSLAGRGCEISPVRSNPLE